MGLKPLFILTLALCLPTPPAQAQVILDISLITCQQFTSSDPDRKELVSAWMSGYFSASKDLNVLDFRYTERNARDRRLLP
jgi:acid stress chaperone HdeB